ncbi:hypothetical protein [Mycolicibacterium goodii]|uniref:aa3-type cytochrome oxidase subunit CtaJ n=1 Tax=Mycolicibacterium goodii TaxID=134601 RepID=UPI0009F87C07
MSTALTHGLIGGVPLVLFAVLALIFLTRKGPHPDTYKMSDPWTHAPILWAAEEPRDHGHGGHGHDSHGVAIGGGASGKW